MMLLPLIPLPSPDGERVAHLERDILGFHSTLVVDDQVRVPLRGSGRGIAWSADGSRACAASAHAVACSDGWSADHGGGALESTIRRVAVDADRVIVARSDGRVEVWRTDGAVETLARGSLWVNTPIVSLVASREGAVAVDAAGNIRRW